MADPQIANLLPYATSQLKDGRTPAALRADLVARGVAEADADQIIREARQVNHDRALRAGVKYLVIGVVCLVAGVGITASTYSAATAHGGTYYVTYGLIGCGVVYTIGGVIRLLTAWAPT